MDLGSGSLPTDTVSRRARDLRRCSPIKPDRSDPYIPPSALACAVGALCSSATTSAAFRRSEKILAGAQVSNAFLLRVPVPVVVQGLHTAGPRWLQGLRSHIAADLQRGQQVSAARRRSRSWKPSRASFSLTIVAQSLRLARSAAYILRSGWRWKEAAGVRRLPPAAVPPKGVNIGGTVLANSTKHSANRHFCARFDSCCLPPFCA